MLLKFHSSIPWHCPSFIRYSSFHQCMMTLDQISDTNYCNIFQFRKAVRGHIFSGSLQETYFYQIPQQSCSSSFLIWVSRSLKGIIWSLNFWNMTLLSTIGQIQNLSYKLVLCRLLSLKLLVLRDHIGCQFLASLRSHSEMIGGPRTQLFIMLNSSLHGCRRWPVLIYLG